MIKITFTLFTGVLCFFFTRKSETLGKFENATLFGLSFTLICHENEAFRERSSNQRNLKTLALSFHVDEKHFENVTFRKRWRQDNFVISLDEFSSNIQNGPVIDAFSNLSGVEWAENI